MHAKTMLFSLSLAATLMLSACVAPMDGGAMAETSTDTMAETPVPEESMAEDEAMGDEMADEEMAEESMGEESMGEDAMGEDSMDAEAMAEDDMMMEEVTFHVRIENISSDADVPTPLSPGAWVLHSEPGALLTTGEPSGDSGLEALSEDGNPGPLAATFEAAGHTHGIFNTPAGATNPGPATPGGAYEFEITATAEMPYLSFATMFVQSNDLFIGPDDHGIALFDDMGHPISGDVTAQLFLWDAGTELNEEPGVGANQAPRQADANTGPTDEDNTVRLVDDGYTYPSVAETVVVTIEPAKMME